jgi:hypothetical protein
MACVPKPCITKARSAERRHVSEFLANQTEGAHVERRVRLRHRVAKQLGLRQQGYQAAKLFIRLLLIRLFFRIRARRDLAPHETCDTRRQTHMLGGEKRRLFDKAIHKNGDR